MRWKAVAAFGSTALVLVIMGCSSSPHGASDMAPAADMAPHPDMVTHADMAGVDMAGADMAIDMATPVDMTIPPDLNQTGTTYTLTAGDDNFTGTALRDTFVGTVAGALGAGDVLNGGDNIDTLTVDEPGAMLAPGAVSISNIEVAQLTSAGSITVDTSGWTGLTSLTTTSAAGSALTAAATTDVTATVTALDNDNFTLAGGQAAHVTIGGASGGNSGATLSVGTMAAPVSGALVLSTSSSDPSTMDSITTFGGTTVQVTQSASNDVNTNTQLGDITVNGGPTTTAVTVTNSAAATPSTGQAGVSVNSVVVFDANSGGASTGPGTVTDISVSNFTVVGIQDNVLRNLTLVGGSGNMIIDNSANLTTPTNLTLNVTFDGATGGTLDDADIYTTLNVTTVNRPSRVSNITFGGLQTLNIAGSQPFTITSTAGMSALQTVTVSGSAGLSADLSSATLTSIDASATSGNNNVTVDASRATFAGGTGADVVTAVNGLSQTIALGGGDDKLVLNSFATPGAAMTGGPGTDTLVMNAGNAATASGSGMFAGQVSGFEQLTLTGTTNQTVDLAALGGFAVVGTSGGNGFTGANFTANGTLTLTGPGTSYTLTNGAWAAGVNDTIQLVLTNGSGAGVAFASSGISAAGVETIDITTADAQVTPSGSFRDTVMLLGNSLQTVHVSGTAGLALTAASSAITTVDASGLTLGGLVWTAGATGAVTVTGSPAADIITILNGAANQIDAGNGDNVVVVGSGGNVIVSGSGDDQITIGAAATASSSINVGSGSDRVTIAAIPTSAANLAVITGMSSGDVVDLSQTNGTAGLSAQTSLGTAVTGATLAALLDLAAAGDGSGTSILGWFWFGGNTYIVHDTSAASTFTAGADTVVELAGMIDLSTATVSGGVITF